MILPMKFASYVLYILAKFRDFLKPVTVQENTLYTCRSFLTFIIVQFLRLVLSWNIVISHFFIKNIINIDNKKLFMYKCIFNLTLEQI